MKTTTIILVTIFSLFYLTSKSQNDNPVIEEYKEALHAEKGYIITQDDEFKQGYIIISKDINNSKYVDFLKFIKAKPERYSIYDIKEYGYNEVIYVTMPYENEVVFMRRMNVNEPFLYYYRSSKGKEFYVKKNDKLVMLPTEKSELRDFLSEEMKNCDISIQNSKLAIYNKQRLSYIFERNSDCDNSRIPFFSYGVYLGVGMNNISLDPNRVFTYYTTTEIVIRSVGNVDYTPKAVLSVGFFADIPLSVYGGKLSFHPELEFKRNSCSFKKSLTDEFGFDINYYSTNLFARYKSLKRKGALFIDFGFIYSILDANNSYYKNISLNKEYEIDPKLENSIYGLGIGAGMSFPFSNRNSIDASLRYSYLYTQSKMPRVSNLDLVVGIAF